MTAAKLAELIKAQDFKGIIALDFDTELANSFEVVHAKVVAYINLEQYQHGFDLILNSKVEKLDFEAAYCLYRLNKLKESFKLLQDTIDSYKSNKDLHQHMLHLKAQVCYRLEEFDTALQIYSDFEMNDEIDTNIVAVEAAKMACTGKSSFKSQTSKSYSSLFNLGCFQIASEKFDLALETLEEARSRILLLNTGICQQDMEVDGYEIDDIQRELRILDSQKAYVLQKIGSFQESLALYNDLLGKDLDPVMKAIAKNNSLAISGSAEVIKVSKALRFINARSVIAKLNSAQTFLVEYNAMVYSLLVKKNAVAIRKLKSLKSRISIDDSRFDYLLYAELGIIKAKSKSNQIPFKEVEQFSQKNPKSIAAKLYLLDTLIKSRKYGESESILTDLLQDINYASYWPGLTSLYVWVLEKTSRMEQAFDLVNKLDGKSVHEIKQLAYFKMKLGRFSEALADFEKVEENLSSPEDLAAHLLCLAHTRPLDTGNLLQQVKQHCAAVELKESVEQLPTKLFKAVVSKKVHRKKKKKLPKNYNPKAVPDPNRWLPKVARDRLKDDPSGFQGATNAAGAGMGSTGSAKILGATSFKDVPSTGKEAMSKEELTAKLSAAAKKKGKKKR